MTSSFCGFAALPGCFVPAGFAPVDAGFFTSASPVWRDSAGSLSSVLSFVDSCPMRPSTSSALLCSFTGFVIAPVSTLMTRDVTSNVPLLSLMKPPVIMYWAPSSLPMRTAVWASIVFDWTSACSCKIDWIRSRSTIRIAGFDAMSLMSKSAMPLPNPS